MPMVPRWLRRRSLARPLGLAILAVLASGWGWDCMIVMPGKSYRGPLTPPADRERALAATLRADVEHLAGTIGARSVPHHGAGLAAAADFIEARLRAAGHQPTHQDFEVGSHTCRNVEVELPGRSTPEEIVVIGAHYDSAGDCPAANDNGSGVAALLALARDLAGRTPARTLRLVAFANEEPPYFQTEDMGSLRYARRCRARDERVVAMLSLETLGYYDEREGSQVYPPPFSLFYPSTGNFLAFVGNVGSRKLVRRAVARFRRDTRFPSEGVAVPGFIPGVGWSDHWSFWQAGYPAIMVTDTAPFRYPHYHEASDTPDKLDYARLARIVPGLAAVVADLAGLDTSSD